MSVEDRLDNLTNRLAALEDRLARTTERLDRDDERTRQRITEVDRNLCWEIGQLRQEVQSGQTVTREARCQHCAGTGRLRTTASPSTIACFYCVGKGRIA